MGQRKDAPTRPQITVMMGSLAPLGMPLSTDVLSGDRAEDGFYIPRMERMRRGWNKTGLLCVGDCQLSALETRMHVVGHHDFSLSPLPVTGATAEAMDAWIAEGVTKDKAGELDRIFRLHDRGQEVLVAEGSECERTCCAQVGEEAWRERGGVVRSPVHAARQAAGGATRLAHAEEHLAALTPPSGRGKRQITEAATLVEAIDHVRKAQRVDGLLSVAWEKQSERHTQYVGRGRGSASRQKRVIKKIRSHITHIARQGDPIADLTQRFGGKACVTNAVQKRRSVQEAVVCSRNAYRIERICNRLKRRVHIAPLCVKRNDHIEGRTSLLTLGVRVLTVMECVLRRSLQKEQATLPGLHPDNKTKMTDTPTAERILKAFGDVSLTIIQPAAGEAILRRLTPWSGLQEAILPWLGLGTALYRQLEIQDIGK